VPSSDDRSTLRCRKTSARLAKTAAIATKAANRGCRCKPGRAATASSGERVGIVAINSNIYADGLEELYDRGINAIWIVEPV